MAKNTGNRGGGGFFRGLIVFGLLCLAAYNAWEIHQLKAEVASLRAATHTPPIDASDAFPNSASLMAAAREHAAAAERWLHLKRYESARDELAAAAQSFQKANADAHAEGDRIVKDLRAATAQISSKTDDGDRATAPTDKPSAGGR